MQQNSWRQTRDYETVRRHFEQRINKSSCLCCLQGSHCAQEHVWQLFHGNVLLFERSSLNIKVSLSEDMLDNFKVLWLLCREVLFLCFVQLVCFVLHCGVDDKDYDCIMNLLFVIYNSHGTLNMTKIFWRVGSQERILGKPFSCGFLLLHIPWIGMWW